METKQATEKPTEDPKPWLAGFWGVETKKAPKEEPKKKKGKMPWEKEFWEGVKATKIVPEPPSPPSQYQPLYPTEQSLTEAIKAPGTGSGYTKKVIKELEAEMSSMTPAQQAEFKKLKGQINAN